MNTFSKDFSLTQNSQWSVKMPARQAVEP